MHVGSPCIFLFDEVQTYVTKRYEGEWPKMFFEDNNNHIILCFTPIQKYLKESSESVMIEETFHTTSFCRRYRNCRSIQNLCQFLAQDTTIYCKIAEKNAPPFEGSKPIWINLEDDTATGLLDAIKQMKMKYASIYANSEKWLLYDSLSIDNNLMKRMEEAWGKGNPIMHWSQFVGSESDVVIYIRDLVETFKI